MNKVTTTTKPKRSDNNAYMRAYYQTTKGKRAMMRAQLKSLTRKLAELEDA